MDMNQLFEDHQFAVIAATRARRGGNLGTAMDLVGHHAERINRKARGLAPDFIGYDGSTAR